MKPALSVAITKSWASHWMLCEFLPTVKLFVSNVPDTSTKWISSPIVADEGKVASTVLLDVSIK